MSSAAGLVTNTRRLELYIRSSVYFLLALELLVALGGLPGVSWVLVGAVAVTHTAANVLVCRWVLIAMRHRPLRPDRRTTVALAAWASLSVAMVVVIAVRGHSGTLEDLAYPAGLLVAIGMPLAAISALLRPLWVFALGVAGGLLMWLIMATRLGYDVATAAGLATSMTIGVLFFVFSFWLSGWMLRVVWELEDARTTAAQLAIAEERLRISRDLHDLFGRTLATVAVKSELAAELIRRGRSDDAATEIAAVRSIADDSGREVRDVVRGYRVNSLDTELDGARSLLDSAGIRCLVERDPTATRLPPPAAAALAWSLREAVTNVIRHSRASECVIRVDGPDPVRLAVTNNGADDAPVTTRSGGNGLVGMSERLAAVGGSLSHRRTGDRFTIEAVVPTHPGLVPVPGPGAAS